MIDDDLKKQVLLRAGIADLSSRDCEQIAVEINQCLDRDISVTTLKRVFGFAKKTHRFSTYTITILQEFAKSSVSDKKLNDTPLLIKDEIYCPGANDKVLHASQLVLEALETLLKFDQESLPLMMRGQCVGIVYTKDIIHFLTCNDNEHGTLFHKFNFDLHSVMVILGKI